MEIVREATAAADAERVRELFLEYQRALGGDLCFQGFSEELASLPGAYTRPAGCLLLALEGERVLGCVGMRPLASPGDCEMKRLYVRPDGRGRGLGRRLATAVIDAARRAGHRRVLLDTLPQMTEARALYRSLGFAETDAYAPNPIAGVTSMALALDAPAVTIDLAIRADRDMLLALLAAQLAEHAIATGRAAMENAIDGMLADERRGFLLLAREAGEAVGVAYVAFTWTFEHGGKTSWLEELYVVPERRSAGIGARLLGAVIERARAAGCAAVDLEVDRDHARAANLYARHGFTPLPRSRWVREL